MEEKNHGAMTMKRLTVALVVCVALISLTLALLINAAV